MAALVTMTLRAEFEALAERFAEVGSALSAASRAMREGLGGPPGSAPSELASLRAAFAEFRTRVIRQAAESGAKTAAAETLTSLDDLEPLLTAVAEAEAARAKPQRERLSPAEQQSRQAALEAAVQRALNVLNRVLLITHRDDPAFRPLLECQGKASELRLTLSRVVAQSPDYSAQRVDEAMLPFADLLTLVTGHDNVDDQRWAQLEAGVVESFGRSLVVAATRGRLHVGGVEPRAPRPEPPVAPPQAAPRPTPAPPPAAPVAPRPASVPSPAAGSYAVVSAAANTPPPADPRGDGIVWWAAARDAWRAWRSSGMAMAHALRAELGKHSYLLSVPIRQSARYDDGAAAGYFLLLEHVENLSPAFMRGAVEQAVSRAGSADPGALEPVLYELLVNRGRLRQTYGDFVRDVMIAALPSPGVWATAGIVEHNEATAICTRSGGAIGDEGEQTKQITEPQQRVTAHTFAHAIAPLTARFFYVRRGEVKDPRDVEIKLTVNGDPADTAWLLVTRMDNLMQPPRRIAGAGTALPDMGKAFGSVWIGVYNPDPDAERRYELAISVRAKVSVATAGLRRSSFGGPPRPR